MLARMRRKGNPSALLSGMKTGTANVEKSIEYPQKIKMGLPFDAAIPLQEYTLRIMKHQYKKILYIYMYMCVYICVYVCMYANTYPCVHSSVIYNSQDLEIA